MTQIHPEHSPDESIHAGDSAVVNRISLNLGGATLIVVVLLMLIIAGNGLIMGLNLAKQSQQDQSFKDLKTQEWLVERRLMDDEAYRIVNGQKLASDDSFGPTGNIHRMKPKEH